MPGTQSAIAPVLAPAIAPLLAPLRQGLAGLAELVGLGNAAIAAMFKPPFYPREVVRAVRAAGGPETLLPVVLMLGTLGAVSALQGVAVLRMFGVERLLSSMLAQVTIRDLAPTMTALMLASQVGTAIAGEIGAMHVSDEADALRTMSVDPVRFLVVPRLVALTLVTPVFTGVGAVSALAAGYVGATQVYGASAGPFIEGLVAQISPGAVFEAICKAAVFGFLCGLLACYHGMKATGGPEGVGRAVNKAIVQSIIVVAGAEALVTAVLLRAAN